MEDITKKILQMLNDCYNNKCVYADKNDIFETLKIELNHHTNPLPNNVKSEIIREVNLWLSNNIETSGFSFDYSEIDSICLLNELDHNDNDY